MSAADRLTTGSGVASSTLMDNAGSAVADAVDANYPVASVLVLCGPGNNGGDGFCAAAHLRKRGYDVRVSSLAALASLKVRDACCRNVTSAGAAPCCHSHPIFSKVPRSSSTRYWARGYRARWMALLPIWCGRPMPATVRRSRSTYPAACTVTWRKPAARWKERVMLPGRAHRHVLSQETGTCSAAGTFSVRQDPCFGHRNTGMGAEHHPSTHL